MYKIVLKTAIVTYSKMNVFYWWLHAYTHTWFNYISSNVINIIISGLSFPLSHVNTFICVIPMSNYLRQFAFVSSSAKYVIISVAPILYSI